MQFTSTKIEKFPKFEILKFHKGIKNKTIKSILNGHFNNDRYVFSHFILAAIITGHFSDNRVNFIIQKINKNKEIEITEVLKINDCSCCGNEITIMSDGQLIWIKESLN